MMNALEAYKWLYAHFAPCGDEAKQDDAITTALNALSKQIPKKPKYSPLKDGIITTFFECPKCGCRRLGHGFNLDKCFCPECGQKLNWEISGND